MDKITELSREYLRIALSWRETKALTYRFKRQRGKRFTTWIRHRISKIRRPGDHYS